MLLRVFVNSCKKNGIRHVTCRNISKNSDQNGDSDKSSSEELQHDEKTENIIASANIQKTVYPPVKLRPRVFHNLNVPDENPLHRVQKAFSHDYETAKAVMKGLPPPRMQESSDILIIGGGIVGSSIACHLAEAAGKGLNICVIEKDVPQRGLSSSLSIATNGLYQQVNSKPELEMAQYAASFYRELEYTFEDPDLSPVNTNFQPCSSLKLAAEGCADALEELTQLYQEFGWRHHLLSPTLLKKKFPWMNTEGISLGCLGMQSEGMFDQWKTVTAMRQRAQKFSCNFYQGEVIGFEFRDLSDMISSDVEYYQYATPGRAVVQAPNGDLNKFSFAYVILAAGSSLNDLLPLLSVYDFRLDLPIETPEQFVYEFACPEGPGLTMPMIMEANGLRFKKSDHVLDKYVLWRENSNQEEVNVDTQSKPNEKYFYEQLLPLLTHRVPTLKNSSLLSIQSALIDKNKWDDKFLIGSVPLYNNVMVAAGFNNDEFLYAPAVGRALAELILEQDYMSSDLSCYRLERIYLNMKL